jgi:glycerol-3-phosphate acyltransferase PlsY
MPWIEQIQSANWTQASWIAVGAYVLGCFTTGYYLVRMRAGRDIREQGSGSVGAKNVGRLLGWTGFFVVLLGDLGKGAFVVWAASHWTKDPHYFALAMLAVTIGHIWPAQLRFRGGKGVATSLGALLLYDYHLTIAFVLLFVAMFAVVRKSVLPGLFAFICLPLVSFYLKRDSVEAVELSILAGVILIAHRKNIMEEILHYVERRNVAAKHNPREL